MEALELRDLLGSQSYVVKNGIVKERYFDLSEEDRYKLVSYAYIDEVKGVKDPSKTYTRCVLMFVDGISSSFFLDDPTKANILVGQEVDPKSIIIYSTANIEQYEMLGEDCKMYQQCYCEGIVKGNKPIMHKDTKVCMVQRKPLTRYNFI